MSGADPHPAPGPEAAGLRRFALIAGAMLGVLFGLLLPWLLDLALPWWPWILGGALAVCGVAAPRSLRPAYRGWMCLARLLGQVLWPIVLGVLFFGVLTPVALIMKLLGRDTMARRRDRAAQSYRVVRNKPPKDHVERPF